MYLSFSTSFHLIYTLKSTSSLSFVENKLKANSIQVRPPFTSLSHFPFWFLKQKLSTNDMMISVSSSYILASLKINSQQQMFTIP